MSIGINMTSKLPKSPLEVTSRPVAMTMMRDDTTVPASFAKKNFGYIKSGSRRNG